MKKKKISDFFNTNEKFNFVDHIFYGISQLETLFELQITPQQKLFLEKKWINLICFYIIRNYTPLHVGLYFNYYL